MKFYYILGGLIFSLLISFYLYFGAKEPNKNVSAEFIPIQCLASPNQVKGVTDANRRWLTKQAATEICRTQLAMAIEAQLRQDIARSNGQILPQDINLKVTMALKLAEIIEGNFMPDGSYHMKMQAPRPIM